MRGYTLRGRYNRIRYIGVTNTPARRAREHRQDGKGGAMRVETRSRSPDSAHRWERQRLDTYRRNHGGKNPPLNKR